jgi:HEAT repeat protein
MLAEALRVEQVSRVREAIFTSLARIGGERSAAAVLPLLRSDDANLRTGALDALRIMISTTRELLPALLDDTDVDVRILSCELARQLPADEATPLLCGRLQRDPDVNVCAAAVDALAEAGNRNALPALNACAQRFRDSPFLVFAIQVTVDRIGTLPPSQRG